MRLPAMPSLREIMQLYDVQALKHLSQNFLLNPRVCGAPTPCRDMCSCAAAADRAKTSASQTRWCPRPSRGG